MPSIGILVVAYNAEATLESVISRIPSYFIPSISVVLICDDASQDATFTVSQRAQAARAELPIQLIRQPINLGYGGNQKAGYRWMIDNSIDIVVQLHGDGQ